MTNSRWVWVVMTGLAAAAQAGLVAEWTLEEGTGTTTAESLSRALSDDFGAAGVTWSSDVPGGGSGYSLGFANTGGVGLNLDSAAVGLDGTVPKTVVAWIKTSATGAEDPIFGYSPTVGSTAGADLRLLVNTAGNLRFEANVGNFAIGSVPVNDGNWWMVGLVIPESVTTSGVSFYTRRVDGVDAGTLAGPGSAGGAAVLNTATGSEMWIGNDGNAGRYFAGVIDNVQVYDSALTQGELDTLYNAMQIPEPATALLLAAGAAALWRRRRTRS